MYIYEIFLYQICGVGTAHLHCDDHLYQVDSIEHPEYGNRKDFCECLDLFEHLDSVEYLDKVEHPIWIDHLDADD